MVMVMFKVVLSAAVFATLALSAIRTVEAAPDVARSTHSSAEATEASPTHASRFASRPRRGLLQIRDIRAGGGGGNGCWNACFTDFDECLGIRTKNLCVSRVKTCLETCDRLSHRPGM